MEVQVSFAAIDGLRLTFDASYTSTYYERRDESHTRSSVSTYTYDYGTLTKQGLSLFDFNLGIKYYFKNIITERVSIYVLAGIGKQVAFAEEENKTLFQNTQDIILSENNEKEFIEDSNSPFHLNVGFGAEYFFNESLSLTSNIRFIYSQIEAKYDSRRITTSETNTSTIDYKKSDFKTRVGLGLNFYF
jgi:hypothetical protein